MRLGSAEGAGDGPGCTACNSTFSSPASTGNVQTVPPGPSACTSTVKRSPIVTSVFEAVAVARTAVASAPERLPQTQNPQINASNQPLLSVPPCLGGFRAVR